MKYLIAFVLLTSPAFAAPKVWIVDDQKQAALTAIFDAAIKASGMSQISKNAFILQEDLNAAGVVTEHKDVPADPPKEPPK